MNPALLRISAQAEDAMKKHLDKMRQEFSTIRTTRANPSLLDVVKVKCYGSELPVKQVGTVAVPDARTLEIRPFDPGTLPDIEKAILASDLGLTPQGDGKSLRLVMPSLTEERRRELVKTVGKMVEQHRVSIRNERRNSNELLKKAEKSKEITEDDRVHGEQSIHRLTEGYIKKVDELLAAKEKEIMEV